MPHQNLNGISPLTDTPAQVEQNPFSNFNCYWDNLLGPYILTTNALGRVSSIISDKRKITSVLAVRKLRGLKQPIALYVDGERPPTLNSDAWSYLPISELLSAYPRSPLELIEESLLNLSKTIDHPSENIHFSNKTVWLVYCYDRTSSAYVLSQLCEMGLLKSVGQDPNSSYATSFYLITAKGWEKLATLRDSDPKRRNQAFVAMSFDDSMNELYEKAIRPAVEENGIKSIRIDRKPHNNKICDEIVAEIKLSRFLVADFTGQRNGVYYETGIARGLGLPVICTATKSDINEIHLDTRQYNHIVYSSAEDLKEQLSARIKATIL